MKKTILTIFISFMFVLGAGAASHADVIDQQLQTLLDTLGPGDEVDVIVSLIDQVDLKKIKDKNKDKSKKELRTAMITELKDKAKKTQKSLKDFLKQKKAKKVISFWIFNGLGVSATVDVINELAGQSGVESIRLDDLLRKKPKPPPPPSGEPEWNLNAIRAPELWGLGYRGAGIVVANMDTGVDADHPDLASRWRGGSNSWFDPNGEHDAPHDSDGHGTQTMGVMVGGMAGGTAIGVAPDAQWIAVKMYDDAGEAAYSDIHLGFQWLLDPDGNSNSNDAPDVVNNSWGFRQYVDQCFLEFQPDIETLKTAEIAVVFSGGNEGPYSSTSISPANYPESFAVGAIDQSLTIANSSSRGPGACDSDYYPELAAPGINIRTSDLTFGGVFPDSYATVSGTSFAAPHLAGAMALLLSAAPDAAVAELESALKNSAVDLGAGGPDDDYGYGLVDVMEAYLTIGDAPAAPMAADDAYEVFEGDTLSVAAPGVLENDSDMNGDPLTANLDGGPTGGTLILNGDGSFEYTPDAGTTTDSFTYTANDGALGSNVATVTITVSAGGNSPPVANDDVATTPKNVPVTINVVANDIDADGTIDPSTVAVTQPDKGTVVSNGDGTVEYTPRRNFRGTSAFTYTVKDNEGAVSNGATVSVTVTR